MVPPKKKRIANPKLTIPIRRTDAEDVSRDLDAFKAATEDRLKNLESEVADLKAQLEATERNAD